MKITDDEYLCKICKVATPSKEIKVKRDKSSSTIKLWNHLERFHVEIYKQLRPSNAPNTLTDYFSQTSKFSGRNLEQTKKECIDLIVKTDAPFTRSKKEVVDFTRYRVKNNSKLTNFKKFTRIEGYNGKYGSNPQGLKEFLDVIFKFDQIGREIDGKNWGKWYFKKEDFKSIPRNQ